MSRSILFEHARLGACRFLASAKSSTVESRPPETAMSTDLFAVFGIFNKKYLKNIEVLMYT